MKGISFWRLFAGLREADLKPAVKLTLLTIGSLQGEDGCRASNAYFLTIVRCKDRQLGNILDDLIEQGLIRREGGRNSRRLFLTDAGWTLFGMNGESEGEADVAPSPPPTISEPANDTAPAPAPVKVEKPKAEKKAKAKVNDTIEEHCARELPDFIPADAWRAFVEYRHKEKGPFTERTATGVINEITRLRADGHDPQLLLELAAERGWLTVYGKDERTKGGTPRALIGDNRRAPSGARMIDGRLVL